MFNFHKRIMCALIIASAALSSAAAAAGPCDYMAGHPDDPLRVTPGIEKRDMDLPAAEKVCTKALAENPGHARTEYQLGRALFYQQKYVPALVHLQRAAKIGYPQAIFVLGYIHATGTAVTTDHCVAGEHWLRSVALDHPWSAYFLVDASLNGQFDKCKFQISDRQLAAFAELAAERITVTASTGRIESMLQRLAAR